MGRANCQGRFLIPQLVDLWGNDGNHEAELTFSLMFDKSQNLLEVCVLDVICCEEYCS